MSRTPAVLIALSTNARRGAEIQGSELATELIARGIACRTIALSESQLGPTLDIDALGESALSLSTLRQLRQIAQAHSVVIGYGSKTLPACTAALAGTSIPFVYRSIGDPADWLRGRVHQWRTGLMFRRADVVAALWSGSAESIGRIHSVQTDRIVVIPNARSADKYVPADTTERHACRERLGIRISTNVITFIGSLSTEKRPHLAVELAGELPPDSCVLIVGDGPLRESIESAAQHSGPDVRVLGPVVDIRSVLACTDVVVSTSTTEGMPGALIEASLMQVPSVATDVGATAEVVGDGGIVVPASTSVAELGTAVRTVLADNEQTGTRSRSLSRFSWDVVAPQWQRLIERVAATP